MYEEMMSKASTQMNDLLAPAKRFNALVVDNLEKLTRFQFEAVKSYTDLGIERMRAALEVNDAASLQAYVAEQQKVAETIGKKLSSDVETLAGLSKDFGSEMQKLAQENVTVATQMVQQAQAAAPKAGTTARKSA